MEDNDLTHTIIGAAYTVHNTLGQGFLESVYENALRIELVNVGISVLQKEKIDVWYGGQSVGKYYPDLLIPGRLVVEVKAVQMLMKEHEVQLVHYLAATHIDIGLLINFGPSVQVKRKFRQYTPKTPLMNAIL